MIKKRNHVVFFYLDNKCLLSSHRCVADRLSRRRPRRRGAYLPAGRLSHARTGGKCTRPYSLLNELTPVIFVATEHYPKNYALTSCVLSQSSYLIFPRRAFSPGTSDWSFNSVP